MSFCTGCSYPHNLDIGKFCIKCGKPLLLNHRYRPLRPLGEGGFGKTFLAVDEHLSSQSNCVIKQLCFPEVNEVSFKKAVELFRQEALRLDELRHPQIPQFLGHFEENQQLYLVQELIVGKTLTQELQQQGVFSEAKIWHLLKDLLPVLQFIHTRQVVHRDIKPDNIMRRMPEGDLVLIDFGVAKQITATALVHTGTNIGSQGYMSPEQMRGKALPASDLYSLGVSCIHLLTGTLPMELFDIISDRWIWRNFLPPENPVTPNLGKILDKLLENALSQRYQSAIEVSKSIQIETNPVKKRPVNTLYSATGVNYKRLRNLLMMKQWQQADQETWVVMCQALSKHQNSYFSPGDLEKFPCEDLQIIDRLWTKYSGGRFGFSVQAEIYASCDRDYGSFVQAVGWNLSKINSSNQPIYFTFAFSAPKGTLPSQTWAGGNQTWKHIGVIAARLAIC
ncbi:serine/threonine-protein kinase [Cronbergia sp. UHCC 0137]|uniref:serine/threonine-protein kinase n=1 Tax=Cronbergia sp. UHCC 0137 TaxID=3110239 RepID=UPI002B202A83|nr:serine/threonine-protein kinase [Cronbergia sp. UHCC 0137]MEA5618263.1 serine/threonine-protein kinase [Cronbergia sp. UHCC 0137]